MDTSKRIRIITGHYGSGKTEFAINYGLKLAKQGKNVAIADMDIVNPYFRSREKKEELEAEGIKVVSTSTGYSTADVPSLSPEIYGLLQNEKIEVVLDVGGDPVGARILGRFHGKIKEGNYDMWMVINVNRPSTQTVEEVMEYLNQIQLASRISITGLINNTHMVRETTIEDILRGDEIVREVAQRTGLPVVFTSGTKEVLKGLPSDIAGEAFPIQLIMRPEWL